MNIGKQGDLDITKYINNF